MVSKIAVMALVAVVAVPILLGYGMNIESNTYTGWEPKDTGSVDVTNFLFNVTDSSKNSYISGDLHLFNSQIFRQESSAAIYPEYESITATNTSIPLRGLMRYATGSNIGIAAAGDEYVQLNVNGNYDGSNYYRFNITKSDNQVVTINHIKSFVWEYNNDVNAIIAWVTYLSGTDNIQHTNFTNPIKVTADFIGSTSPGFYQQWRYTGMTGYYADISDGWILNPTDLRTNNTYRPFHTDVIPNGISTDEMVFSFNLDSITASTYWMGFYYGTGALRYHLEFIKETIGGAPHWYYRTYGDPNNHELYYNSGISSNTYQVQITPTGGEFRYIGAWTDTLGVAPALITYPFEISESSYNWVTPGQIPRIRVFGETPITRIDYAKVASYTYRILRDVTYNPVEFRSNPITEFSNITEYGDSLTFGGNTYDVESGNITIGTKQLSVRNLAFRSVPNGSGYDNFINDILISSTANPSTLVFNGDWVLSVITTEQESVTYSEMKWEPGKFAWNGIDTNFKMAGLMASLGTFIALAIYGRRSGAKVLPLLLICGGAALMFLVMI